jgi:hypothetical protein
MTDAQYRRQWNRLYVQSMRANSAEESERIQKRLDRLNALRAASK